MEKFDTVRSEVLNDANELIHGDRQAQYGPPDENFQNIAKFWNVRFKHLLREGAEFSASDVAVAMALLKIGRDMQGYNYDSAVDGAGYLALYAEIKHHETHGVNE